MTFTTDIVINIIIIMAGALSVFFTVKNKTDKNDMALKKNIQFTEALETTLRKKIEDLQTSTHDNVENHYSLLKQEIDKIKDIMALTKKEIDRDIKHLTSTAFDTMEKNKDNITNKVLGIKDDLLNKIETTFNRIDILKDDVNKLNTELSKLFNETTSIVDYELVHIKNDVNKVESTMKDVYTEIKNLNSELNSELRDVRSELFKVATENLKKK